MSVPNVLRSGLKRSFAAGLFAFAAFLVVSPARADVTDVMREIERAGDARVIITMKTGDGRAAWEAARSVEQQRAVVADASERFARSMSAAEIPVRKRYRTLPFAGARVNREQLLKLAGMPEVTGIQLVRNERKHQVSDVTLGDVERQSLANSVPSIDVQSAWAQGADGTGTTVAVVDGGFNFAHAMLKGKSIGDACFADSYGTTLKPNCPSGATPQIADGAASNCSDATRCAHGTHVASIAAGNDGTNFGVARGAKIVPIDVFSKDTDAADCSPDPAPCEVTNSLAVLDALDYINDHAIEFHVAAVNLSLGGATVAGYCDDDPRKAVIDMLRKKGVAVVVSAGNDGATGMIEKPACISSAVAVGATDNGTNVASFSNFATTLDLMAPGTRIVAASASSNTLLATMTGTSMAAPHVAGAFAVLRSAMPNSTTDQLEDALKTTGARVTRTNAGYSVPRIQVGRALNYLKGRNGQLFNQIVSGAGATSRGQSYLRIFNNTNAAGVVVATVRDVDSGAVLGKWTSPSIPAHASPQVPITTIEAAISATAPQTFAARTGYNLEIESSFGGYVQYLLLAPGGVFANMTSCRDGLTTGDSTALMNVNTSSVADYVSRLRVTNTGAVAGSAILTFSNATTGARIASWTSPSIAPNASLDVAEPDIEAAVSAISDATKAGALQFNVTLESLSGYLQHVIENRRASAFTDFTARCPISASTSVAAN